MNNRFSFTHPLPENEEERLLALHGYRLLDSEAEPAFDAIVQAASDVCGTPVSLVSLIDRERQWFKASRGIGGLRETSRDISLCSHAILGNTPLEVADVRTDARFADNPLVLSGPQFGFYFGVPLINPDGFALGTLCVIDREPRQINAAQKLALEGLARVTMALIESRRRSLDAARLERFVEQTPNPLYAFDCDSLRLSYANAAALKSLGVPRALAPQLLPQIDLPETKPWLPAEAFRAELEVLRQKDRSQSNFEATDRDADGREYPVQVRLLHFLDAYGEVFFAISRDISEEKRLREEVESRLSRNNADLEQRVRERTAELEASNRDLSLFAATISHDLRAPLRAISGFAGILQEDYGVACPAEAMQLLTRIGANAGRMGAMIDSLMKLARQSLRMLERRTVDMNALVREVLEEFEEERARRGVEVVLGDLPECQADEELLRHMLANLVGNAFKYTRERSQPRIEVGWHPDGLLEAYYVRDNGAGFDMARAEWLFQPWHRLHPEERFEGSGIGLALAARIVDRHGGRIWAEAAPDEGATFFFTINGHSGISPP